VVTLEYLAKTLNDIFDAVNKLLNVLLFNEEFAVTHVKFNVYPYQAVTGERLLGIEAQVCIEPTEDSEVHVACSELIERIIRELQQAGFIAKCELPVFELKVTFKPIKPPI
jgi:hypothetical protein